METSGMPEFLQRLCRATNDHDLDRLVDLFTEDYVSEIPVHPSQSFRGREQVRRNWTQIFAAVPDVGLDVLQAVQVGQTVWSEVQIEGHRVDGAPHLLRGVLILTVDNGRASAVRFYLEPVDLSEQSTDEAVRKSLAR